MDENSFIALKIEEVQKIISKKFNSDLHQIYFDLSHTYYCRDNKKINLCTKIGDKSKNKIQADAKLYEQLRQKMSTKEFVEQYEKGLTHD